MKFLDKIEVLKYSEQRSGESNIIGVTFIHTYGYTIKQRNTVNMQ